MPDDAREQVVEVVRDAAGKLADGLGALGPAQALLELASIGHVGGDSHDPEECTVPTEARCPDVEQPRYTPSCRRIRNSVWNGVRCAMAVRMLRQRGRAVFRMQPVGPAVAELRRA